MQGLEFAVIGNCAVASLVGREGRHIWFCFPRLDGDPLFCSLLGGNTPEAGFMDVVVRDATAITQAYVAHTPGPPPPPPRPLLNPPPPKTPAPRLKMIDFAPRFERFGRTFRPPLLVRR